MFKPMLTHQVIERFGVRSALQEHLLKLKQPIVSPEVLLKSEVALPENDVLDDILKDSSVNNTVPEVEAFVPKLDVSDEAITTAETEVWNPPDCEPEIDPSEDVVATDITSPDTGFEV